MKHLNWKFVSSGRSPQFSWPQTSPWMFWIFLNLGKIVNWKILKFGNPISEKNCKLKRLDFYSIEVFKVYFTFWINMKMRLPPKKSTYWSVDFFILDFLHSLWHFLIRRLPYCSSWAEMALFLVDPTTYPGKHFLSSSYI